MGQIANQVVLEFLFKMKEKLKKKSEEKEKQRKTGKDEKAKKLPRENAENSRT